MEVTVSVYSERGSLWSEVSELPGCFASGRTVEELRESLAEAVGLYLWDSPGELRGDLRADGESRVEVVPRHRAEP
ncbi:MAG TPA: type II toxin-antitoxin system HicB family antitoxin [Solirubrobacteraceae bacterium]|jgi:predicted RNase H-like HicB family nuclease